jgi:hypothetical protein
MTNYQDFGFTGEEFRGEIDTPPYCQFFNASNSAFGLAITPANAELAQFKPTDGWSAVDHEFADGTQETLWVTKQPRMTVINRSVAMMSDGAKTVPYDRKLKERDYSAFSYVVVWLLDQSNQPLSTLPFRLRCSGYAGTTLLKNYQYYNNPNSFTKKFLEVYKSLTGDRSINKNEIFYAHGVYCPNLVRERVTSSYNGQSSFAVVVNSFIQPTPQNFGSLIIKNGSKVSNQIKEYQETTKSWLKGEQLKESVEEQPTQQRSGIWLLNRAISSAQTAEETRDEALNYEAIEF